MNKQTLWSVPLLALAVMHAAPRASAQNNTPLRQDIHVSSTDVPLVIDGRLDEPAWRDAAVIPLPYEWSPGDNTPAPVRTECRVTFDAENLYVGFRAFDPDPTQIRAHFRDRDSGTSDDTVGFLIDTFDDDRRAFQFRVNPLGVQLDAVNNDIDGTEDFSWDAIWDARGRIDDAGYVVEIAIPFRQLRFPRTSTPQSWGFLAIRHYPRSLRHRLRSEFLDRSSDCLVCQFGKIDGLVGIASGSTVEITPTLTAGRTDRRTSPDAALERDDESLELGLSARWNATPNIALDVALNPDFSQVEADDAQLEINTRFALFFPEKRPFFLEGADYFDTLLPAVFTRTVADPKAGIKFTGKEGVHSGGLFYARDGINNLIFPGYDGSDLTSIEQEVNSTVARYRVDVGSGSNLGALYTGRVARDYFNHVGGVDGTWRPWSTETVRFQFLHSSTRYPDVVAEANGQPMDPFDGNAGSILYTHNSALWYWSADYGEFAPGFRADSGFVTRVGTRQGSVALNRTMRGRDTWFSRLDFFVGSDWTRSVRGGIRENGQDLSISYEGPHQIEAFVQVSPNDEYFDGENYDNTRYSAGFGMQPTGDFGFELFGNAGGTIDVSNSREATFALVEPEVEWNLGRRLRGDLSHTFQRVEAAGDRLYTANLSQLTLLYHLNIRTFVRVILQYRNIDRNRSNYLDDVDSRSERLFTQWFFSYKLNPRTVVLAGYADTSNASDAVDLTRNERSLFMKLGYSFQP